MAIAPQITSLDQTVIDQIQQVLDQLDNTLTYNLGLVQVGGMHQCEWTLAVLPYIFRSSALF